MKDKKEKKNFFFNSFFNSFFSNDYVDIFFIGTILTLLSFFIDSYVVMFMSIIQNFILIDIFSIITMLGNIEFFIPISIVISIFFFARKKRIFGLWLSIIVVGIIVFFMKLIINRPRPFVSQNLVAIINTNMSSFPSGHAMIVFSLVPFMTKNFPNHKNYFFAIAILVAFSRIYLNVHYLSDIVAGGFIGYLVGLFFSRIENKK
ncbi:TPA: phosphatase PAP2 family protein [bacterium]|nr:phosphatase PAP2 family protein [bacterium]